MGASNIAAVWATKAVGILYVKQSGTFRQASLIILTFAPIYNWQLARLLVVVLSRNSSYRLIMKLSLTLNNSLHLPLAAYETVSEQNSGGTRSYAKEHKFGHCGAQRKVAENEKKLLSYVLMGI